jgi:hypothetical protein
MDEALMQKKEADAAQSAVSGKLLRKVIGTISRDRRMAAIHEAGHVVMTRKLGLPLASAWIVPNDGGGFEEKFWTGRVQRHATTKPTKRQRRMVGVAGAIAELSWEGEFDDIDDLEWCHDWWWDPAIMSESDWDMAGCPPGEPDEPFFNAIEKVGALLQRNTGPPIFREPTASQFTF